MRILFSFCLALLLVACGSDGSSPGGSGGAPSASGGAPGGGGGAAIAQGKAQVRFLYQAGWEQRLGSCAWISDYRLKFGGNPLPITVPIDVMADALGEYVGLEGRTYEDADVLHIFSCSQSQTSKQTKQEYGRFGADLSFEADKRYTVTLGGSAATVAEDP
jgi:hypothetical protein